MQRVKHTLRFVVKDGCRVSGYFDLMKTLPERVQEAVKDAKARGYSVQKIADEIGLSRQAVYAWLRGESKSIDGENLVELAEISGVSARWIINGKGKKHVGLSQEEKTLIQAFNIADKSVREMFLVMARAELGKIKMNAA